MQPLSASDGEWQGRRATRMIWMGARPAGAFTCTTHSFLGFSWLSEVPWSGDIQAISLGQCKSASVSDEASVFLPRVS